MEITGPLPGRISLQATHFDLGTAGYIAEEYFLSGEAVVFSPVDAPLDGRWTTEPKAPVPFRTRLVVHRPDAAAFNGVVVVEWLNVSAGSDGAPFWTETHRHIMRSGMIWVGISVQRAGLYGGSTFTSDLLPDPVTVDQPDRYRSLEHPGDAYCPDLFSKAADAIREGLLGPLEVRRVLAAGKSQSARGVIGHINAVTPHHRPYDGYLLLGRPGRMQASEDGPFRPYLVRTDGRAPILMLQAESDVLGARLRSKPARQADGERCRLWELAGSAHADTYAMSLGPRDDGTVPTREMAEALDPAAVSGLSTARPVNSGPQHHYVAQAALAALDRWVAEGVAPATAALLEEARDGHGVVLGGVRTPWVDVPAAVLSGLGQENHPGDDGFATNFGSTGPLDLAALYPGGLDDYLPAFRRAAEHAVGEGFLLAADLDEILALAVASFSR
ncbi:alpha/beta hydrolase domain-containing protein [Actinomadura hibisca]|uniref:alpha/beta hydrolase domain-containing protein n=1 Tax=Actinomadura hibisca TaxID=68565 RepID=UPI0008301A1F|nr:alpha/beta hydrolase domain-containing protein [Actinomadura hibisca]